MPTPLHDLDTLSWLSEEGQPTARDWARDRLAVLAPERDAPAASDADWPAWLCGGPAFWRSRVDWLTERAPTQTEAVKLARLLEAGTPAPDGLGAALRRWLDKGDDVTEVWITWCLSLLGEGDSADLQRLAHRDDPGLRWVLAASAIRASGSADAARSLGRRLARDEAQLVNLLEALGLPADALFSVADTPQPDILPLLSERFGLALPDRLGTGSRKRRVQRQVDVLLEGIDHPAAHVLRGAFADGIPPQWLTWPIALAAWLRAEAEAPVGPVEAVLDRWSLRRLAEARDQLTEDDAPLVLGALAPSRPEPTRLLAGVLSLSLPTPPAEALLDVWHQAHMPGVLLEGAAQAVAHRTDRIADGLSAGDELWLFLADWCPTEEVLGALLALDVPPHPAGRDQLAHALANMGDAAAAPVLAGLVQADGLEPYAESISLWASITGQTLA